MLPPSVFDDSVREGIRPTDPAVMEVPMSTTAMLVIGGLGLALWAFMSWLFAYDPSLLQRRMDDPAVDSAAAALRAEAAVRAGAPRPLATIFRLYVRAGTEVVASADLVRALRAQDPRLSVPQAFRVLKGLEEAEVLLLIGSPVYAVHPGDLALSPPGAIGSVLAGARTLIPLARLRAELSSRDERVG